MIHTEYLTLKTLTTTTKILEVEEGNAVFNK